MNSATWRQEWQAMIDSVGTDFGAQYNQQGADAVEAGAIRRFLEPLEFDCALHRDPQAALEHGYRGIIAPYSSLMTWITPALWEPGRQVWDAAGSDAQPNAAMRFPWIGDHIPQPPTTRSFATDLQVEYVEPIVVGDHLSISGAKLLACKPKETSVGRGAFLMWQSEVRNQNGSLVARVCFERYCYNPVARSAQESAATPEAGRGTHGGN
ncbi:FAS1-like dehydratase domain-containing protein [Ottowia sp. VDI28]|uniref:FAS1-like dehydratase domain-containing protein n=1 Tax=Ottowia sp. VDI28 TaxID=3133968 RepID=UPI003C2DCF2A